MLLVKTRNGGSKDIEVKRIKHREIHNMWKRKLSQKWHCSNKKIVIRVLWLLHILSLISPFSSQSLSTTQCSMCIRLSGSKLLFTIITKYLVALSQVPPSHNLLESHWAHIPPSFISLCSLLMVWSLDLFTSTSYPLHTIFNLDHSVIILCFFPFIIVTLSLFCSYGCILFHPHWSLYPCMSWPCQAEYIYWRVMVQFICMIIGYALSV